MDDHSLKALDFYALLDLLKAYATSSLGQKRCKALTPSQDLPLIRTRLAEVLELKKILETVEDLPIQGIKDIEGILKKVEIEESVLTVQELLELHHHITVSSGLKRFFQKLPEGEAPLLQKKVSTLSSLRSLEKEILRVVSPKGEIMDHASPALFDIRDRMRVLREKAKGILEHLLHQPTLEPIYQDQFITLRNGRYVLPVKSEHQDRLPGIVHDQSHTHMTLFIEPLQVVAMNNEINILAGEEKDEEYRILSDLSKRVREEVQGLRSDCEILGEVDFLYAVARLSIRLNAVAPVLNEEGRMEMMQARHPLLLLQKEDQVVPIDLRLGDGIKVLIISGANAGGKTVALKTLGLLTSMVQCGLPIPVAEGSRISIFRKVFALIGDEQNIEENLSTFSSHLLHLNQIVREVGPRSLVLLDELGVGTHASEGCALAMGFLDQLRETGATIAVTTHFDGLKTYGYLHPDVQNVAVEFDEKTLEPKYHLAYGSSGLSNAFLIAEKLGISAKVLERAKHYHDGSGQEVARALESLEKLKAQARKEREGLLETEAEVHRERQKLKDLLESIKNKRQEIFARAEEKARKAAQRVEEELKEWLRQQREERKSLRLATLHRKEIQQVKERFFPVSRNRKEGLKAPERLKVGDRVRIEPLRSEGVLMKVEAPLGRVEVSTDKGIVKVPFSHVVKIREDEEGKEMSSGRSVSSKKDFQETPSEVKIIGLTVDDAIPVVDKFIDRALLHGLEKICIVHGIGSGRLRHGIGEYLKGHRGVKSFGPGDPMKGGGGVTIVELK